MQTLRPGAQPKMKAETMRARCSSYPPKSKAGGKPPRPLEVPLPESKEIRFPRSKAQKWAEEPVLRSPHMRAEASSTRPGNPPHATSMQTPHPMEVEEFRLSRPKALQCAEEPVSRSPHTRAEAKSTHAEIPRHATSMQTPHPPAPLTKKEAEETQTPHPRRPMRTETEARQAPHLERPPRTEAEVRKTLRLGRGPQMETQPRQCRLPAGRRQTRRHPEPREGPQRSTSPSLPGSAPPGRMASPGPAASGPEFHRGARWSPLLEHQRLSAGRPPPQARRPDPPPAAPVSQPWAEETLRSHPLRQRSLQTQHPLAAPQQALQTPGPPPAQLASRRLRASRVRPCWMQLQQSQGQGVAGCDPAVEWSGWSPEQEA